MSAIPWRARPQADAHTREFFKARTAYWAEQIVNRGCIRVGTLEHYRAEEHGSAVRDGTEGVITVQDEIIDLDSMPSTPFIDAIRKQIEDGRSRGVSLPTYEYNASDDRAYVYSLSDAPSKIALEKYQAAAKCEGERYDTYVAFRNIPRVRHLIANKLADLDPAVPRHQRSGAFIQCVYAKPDRIDRVQWRGAGICHFVGIAGYKPRCYDWQREWRIVIPTNAAVSYVDLVIPKLRPLCRIVPAGEFVP